ncbi:MAG TPA: hypothetical protein VE422_45580 [Terriglobia bacterium]|nr:hypothetical protein [Terriglobia bacterium]
MSKNDELTLNVGRHLRRYLVLALWVVAGTIYAHMVFQWIEISSKDREFARSMQHAIQLVGMENRPSKDLRALLLVRAEAFSIPIRGNEILINGKGETLEVSLRYEADITFPLLDKAIYRMMFNHQVRFRPPNT